jgi:hypothetical protein
MFCYKGEWFVPPQNTRQSQQVTWAFAKSGDEESMNKAMQNWYTKERKIASLLYPLQDKEEKCSETTGGKRSTRR